MRIKFACPHCDHVCRVPAELAGKQGRCPECLRGLEVPTESTLQSHRADAARRSAQGTVELRDDMVSGQGEVERDTSERTKAAQSDRAKAEPAAEPPATRHCNHCNKQIDMETTTCPHCGGDATLKGAPWQVIAALFCVIPFPLPGLIFAQFGLIASRKRRQYGRLAWTAVILNGLNLIGNILYYVIKALRG